MLTAAARALHREEGAQSVLDDPLAAGLAGDGGATMLEQVRGRLSTEGLQSFVRWVALRGRFNEDLVADAVRDGIGQYVILGAGLDSFAYRRPRLLERLRVYEVDHPASQAWKRSRLADLGVSVEAKVVFVPIDFESQTVMQRLRETGFDVGAPAIFAWMGVTMYLTPGAIRATLKDVASSASGSRLVMTYNQPLQTVDGFSRHVVGELSAAIGEGGEPFLSVFTPDEVHALLRGEGWVVVEDLNPSDVQERYFEAAARLPMAGAQRVLVARLQ